MPQAVQSEILTDIAGGGGLSRPLSIAGEAWRRRSDELAPSVHCRYDEAILALSAHNLGRLFGQQSLRGASKA